jgi:hypothetical protein
MNSRQRISDFQSFVNSQVAKIRKEAGEAWKLINLSQCETKIIYSFLSSTQGGTGYLNRHLAPILGTDGRTVKFASIFLHQKPKVKGLGQPGDEKEIGGECELGDLQILFLYLAADKSVCQCRSIIFQAKKKPNSGKYVIDTTDQRRLYDECSGFEYRSVLTGEKRCLPQESIDRERALQYLFVGERPIRARLIPADVNKGAFVDFGELIVRVLNDSTGLNVTQPATGNGWSRIVWDQIEHVAETAFAKKGARNNGIDAIVNRFNSFEDRSEFFHDAEGEPGGIPMLLIIVSDGELVSVENLQTQGHTETKGVEPSATSVETVTIGVVEQTKTDTAQEDENQSPKKNLDSAPLDDLLMHLECATQKKQQPDILLELKRRSEYQQITADDANKVLVVLDRICDCLDPEIMPLVDDLKQKLSAIKQKVRVRLENFND